MLFDSTLMFYHATSGANLAWNFTAGEFTNLAGMTGGSAGLASSVINLGNARDLGIGEGAERPNVALAIGTAITSSLATMGISVQFQGSTDSSTWTTYMETPSSTTASFAAASLIQFPVPHRSVGAALPLYYRINLSVTGNGTVGISTGTILGGIVLAPAESITLGQYPGGFTVA